MENQTKRGGKRPGSGRKPGIQNKVTRSVKAMAQDYSADAVDVLAQIMSDPEAPPAARVAAAGMLLDRAAGKPKQEVEVSAEFTPVDTAALDELYRVNMAKTAEMAKMAQERLEELRRGALN